MSTQTNPVVEATAKGLALAIITLPLAAVLTLSIRAFSTQPQGEIVLAVTVPLVAFYIWTRVIAAMPRNDHSVELKEFERTHPREAWLAKACAFPAAVAMTIAPVAILSAAVFYVMDSAWAVASTAKIGLACLAVFVASIALFSIVTALESGRQRVIAALRPVSMWLECSVWIELDIARLILVRSMHPVHGFRLIK